jgi:hypothetical protein
MPREYMTLGPDLALLKRPRSYRLTSRLSYRPLGASVKEAEELTMVAEENGVRTIVGMQGRS